MDTQNIFLQAFIYLAAALVAIIVGKRLGIGAVLGYLLMGIVIGPFGLRIIGHSEDIMHFAEFGVVMMLFLIGLELQPAMLWRMRRKILGLGGLQVVLTTAAICAIAMSFGLIWQQALAIGMILSLSSTAIILQTLTERGLIQTEVGKSSFAVLLFQDIAVIPIIAVIPLLATMEPAGGGDAGHSAADFLHHLPGWAQALATIGSVVFIVLVARWACRPLFRMIAATRQMEAFTTAALLIVIGVAILMNFVGLSPALGAFVAGVVLASSEYRHELESDLAPFKGILLGIFFISVGVGIDFSHIAGNLIAVVGITFGLITLKGLLLIPLARINGLNRSTSLLFASSMAAGGEFAFVLLNITLGNGVLDPETVRTITAAVAISMALTPPLIILTQRYAYRDSTEKKGTGEPDVEDENSPVIICGFGRYGHAVGRLLRTQGFGCTVLDWDEDQISTLREIGIPVFYGDASRPDLLAAAGAGNAKVLVLAIKDAPTVSKIVQSVRHSFPHLKIYIRALGRLEAYEFLDIGEENVYRETLESSMLMSEHIMTHLGFPDDKSKKASCHYRTNDEKMVREMAKHRHDKKAYMSNAKQAVSTFDELMRANMDNEEDCGK
ncbi:monovalent cation:proton antiporter-2 (CPA2) family protein [Luteolibacter sp. AS25]|uniref:monovalent cation:proton antiporter-2 (CPA2) family protein n=1 Tax=Luteolibacter sp. AS25 TaxID=3135776 RepID=UPI00398AAA65